MLGTTYFEKRLLRNGERMILDFDDSIWLKDISPANKSLAFLKKPEKLTQILRMADAVTVGNQYLAEYAERYNDHVEIIPSTIDTQLYQPDPSQRSWQEGGPIRIGWTGSNTTIAHFETALPILRRLQTRLGDRLIIRLIADREYSYDGLNLEPIAWTAEREVEDLQPIDIGIMPLPDTPWTRGKCAMKGLQYMALRIPTVMSPVGVNRDVIDHGVNGFLCSTEPEWERVLLELSQDPALRERIGQAGRQTVTDHYSIDSMKDRYVELFERMLAK
jgi:glycosyltransferase involved in cell wall biosynthesis